MNEIIFQASSFLFFEAGIPGGGIAPPWDTGIEKKEGRTLKYYLIHIILNPNDPLLKTFIDYRD